MAQGNGMNGNGSRPGALVDLRTARMALAAARGNEKLDLLLGLPDPAGMIPKIPANELYLAILDIGADDAAEVISLASPEQFAHFVDASAWPRRDAGPDPKKLMHWLVLAREGGGNTERSQRRFLAKLDGLDPELFSLTLRNEVIVHDLSENEEPNIADDNHIYRTAEGKYLVEIKAEGAGYGAIKRLLDDLTHRDPFGTTRMLEALRWEVPTELEESAHRWREGRLRDLGVPDWEEALAFFARPSKPKTAAPEAVSQPVATSALEAVEKVPLLDRAVALLDGDQRDTAEEGIVYACNAALVAQDVPLDENQEVRRVLSDARALLSTGLELMSSGDEARAAEVLATRPIREVFQAAMAELYRLQTRARTVAKTLRLPQAQSATLLDAPLASMLSALQSVPPTLAFPLGDHSPKAITRAPGSRLDLLRAEALLDECAALAALLPKLGFDLEKLGKLAEEAQIAPSALRMSDVVRMAVFAGLRYAEPTLKDLPDRAAPLPEGFAGALERLLTHAAAQVGGDAIARAVSRLQRQAS